MKENPFSCNKQDVNQYLPAKFTFFGYASFETRSMTIPLSIAKERIARAVVFYSKGYDNSEAKMRIKNKLDNLPKFKELDLTNPISIARSLTNIVKGLFADDTPFSLVVDITAFTHETLLMFVKLILNNMEKFESVQFLYNGAEGYSINTPLAEAWLSKGCKDVRNVIGFPGLIRPSAKTCLVLLAGFELERATKLIEWLEPDRIALGYAFEPTSDNHVELMNHFKNEFGKWQNNYMNNNVSTFEFSSKDVLKTVNVLKELIDRNQNDNYIIAPLNTKLSTLATAIIALQHSKIQICYSIPEIYNVEGYSTPSQNITVFRVD